MISVGTGSGNLQAPPISVPGVVGAMTISPDGRTLWVASGSSVVPVDTATNTRGTAIAVGAEVGQIALSPDGRTLLALTADGVTPISTETGTAGSPIRLAAPAGIAISPNGEVAYVLGAGDTLTPIDLGTDTPGAPISLSHHGVAIATTPDGALAVIAETDEGASTPGYLQLVDLATGKVQPPVVLNVTSSYCPPQNACGTFDPFAVTVAPNGKTAYVSGDGPELDGWSAVPFDIASGTLGPAVDNEPGDVSPNLAVSGDSTTLFVELRNGGLSHGFVAGSVVKYNTATNKLLGYLDVNALGVSDGGFSFNVPYDVVLAPSPSASLTAVPGQTGTPSTFDASASTNDGGSVTGHAWQFGDGTGTITAGPTVSHSYAQPGVYTVTLTTTNVGGCAATFAFTGQSTSCTGSPTATTTRTVKITSPTAVAATGRASNRGQRRATLHGTIRSASQGVIWQFQYGTSTHYGKRTPLRTIPATVAAASVSATPTGLAPNRRYDYRLVATTPEGAGARPVISYGRDASFRTGTTGTLRLRSRVLTIVGDRLAVPLRCISRSQCRGRLILTTHTRARPHRALPCGRGRLHLAPERRGHDDITLRPACLALLRRHGALKATLASLLSTGQRGFTTPTRLRLRQAHGQGGPR